MLDEERAFTDAVDNHQRVQPAQCCCKGAVPFPDLVNEQPHRFCGVDVVCFGGVQVVSRRSAMIRAMSRSTDMLDETPLRISRMSGLVEAMELCHQPGVMLSSTCRISSGQILYE
ncbi:MAG: hypothetical protein ABIU96_03015 [Rhodanobacter sp.]